MSTNLSINSNIVPSMSDSLIDKVRQFENMSLQLPQTDIGTFHVIHAGMYARTILIPAGTILTGALIKIATLLIVQGNVTICVGEKVIELEDYSVIPACANRKQAFIAHTDTFLTMIFASQAKGIYQAEDEFTDEVDLLISRRDGAENKIMITGE